MARPDRRGENFTEAPYSAPDDNGADGIDWETGTLTPTELTVEESDASPSVTPVDTIKLDAADFTLVDNADGSVSVTTDEPDATAHIADTTDAHDASAISIVDSGGYYTGTDVEAALQEIGAGGGGGGGITVQDEGTPLTTAATTLNFTGSGVTASGAGATKTITISGGGGGSGPLESHTASASASLNFTGWYSSAYTVYEIVFENVVPATDGVDFRMRVSTNTGSSYDSGNNYRYNGLVAGGGTSVENSNPNSYIAMSYQPAHMDSGSNWGLAGTMRLYLPASTGAYKTVLGHVHYMTNEGTPALANYWINGVYLSTTAVDAFQFYFSSGNIASGTIRVYGIPT